MNTFLTLLLVLSLSAIAASKTHTDFIATALSGMKLIEKIEQVYQKERKENHKKRQDDRKKQKKADKANSHEVKK